MAEHIFIPDRFRNIRAYTKPPSPISWRPPDRDRQAHGNYLNNRLKHAWDAVDKHSDERRALGLPDADGTRIAFRLRKGSELQFAKLEGLKQKVRLRHVFSETINGEEFMIVVAWVPKEKRSFFAEKLRKYLEEETQKGRPKNNDLIACIEDIRSALLEDYWPKHEQGRIPTDDPDWVEVWLAAERADDTDEEVKARLMDVCRPLGIQVADRMLHFPERRILLAKAKRAQLQELIERCDEVAELRLARECAGFFLRDREVHRWIEDLISRLSPPDPESPAVCVLDTGVNRGHPLLQPVCQESDCVSVMPSWGVHDQNGHGTGMCGLAAYGPLEIPLASSNPVALTHWVESVKLHGPKGHPDTLPKDLWGEFTQRAAYEIEFKRPDRSRVFCMAITSIEDMDRGMPSSWSGTVDQLASGYLDDNRRLILISAGNVVTEQDLLAYPDSNASSGIQDPAQAWNVITVGAFTDKVTFSDEEGSRAGFLPLAEKGDLSPHSTTSLIDWDKTWPVKPDIVCEGGNLLRAYPKR